MDVSMVYLINKYYRDLSYSFIYLLGAEEAVKEQLPSGDEALNLQGESFYEVKSLSTRPVAPSFAKCMLQSAFDMIIVPLVPHIW